jgi:hypothetical protein
MSSSLSNLASTKDSNDSNLSMSSSSVDVSRSRIQSMPPRYSYDTLANISRKVFNFGSASEAKENNQPFS